MDNSIIVKECSVEFASYVSAFCATPKPSRRKENLMIKKLIDENKIDLLKAVVVEVASILSIHDRFPVFQALAKKFGVFHRNNKYDESSAVTKVSNDHMQAVPAAAVKSEPSSHISIPSQPTLIHHLEIASDINSKSLQDIPLYKVEVKFMTVKEEHKISISPPDSPFIPIDPLSTSIKSTTSINATNIHEACSSEVPTLVSPQIASCWNPPASAESSSIMAKEAQLSFVEKSLPIAVKKASLCRKSSPIVVKKSSLQTFSRSRPNPMFPVDPATLLPLLGKSSLKSRSGEKFARAGDPFGKQKKHGKKVVEHWVLRRKISAEKCEGLFFCDNCGDSFKESSTLNRHNRHAHKIFLNPIKSVSRPVKSIKITCDICGRKCEGKKSLDMHTRRAHNPKSTVPCPENCGKLLTSRDAIKKHLLSHRPEADWPVSCPLCKKRFQARSDIKKHLLSSKHKRDNLPEVGSEGWWALIYEDKPDLIQKSRRRSK